MLQFPPLSSSCRSLVAAASLLLVCSVACDADEDPSTEAAADPTGKADHLDPGSPPSDREVELSVRGKKVVSHVIPSSLDYPQGNYFDMAVSSSGGVALVADCRPQYLCQSVSTNRGADGSLNFQYMRSPVPTGAGLIAHNYTYPVSIEWTHRGLTTFRMGSFYWEEHHGAALDLEEAPIDLQGSTWGRDDTMRTALDSRGRVHAAFRTAEGSLYHSVLEDDGHASAADQIAYGTHVFNQKIDDAIDMAIDDADRIWAGYFKDGRLHLAHKNANSSQWTDEVIDDGIAERTISVLAGASGQQIIVYSHNDALWQAERTPSGWDFTQVLVDRDFETPAVELDALGRTHVAFVDSDDEKLHYLRPSGAGGWTEHVVEEWTFPPSALDRHGWNGPAREETDRQVRLHLDGLDEARVALIAAGDMYYLELAFG